MNLQRRKLVRLNALAPTLEMYVRWVSNRRQTNNNLTNTLLVRSSTSRCATPFTNALQIRETIPKMAQDPRALLQKVPQLQQYIQWRTADSSHRQTKPLRAPLEASPSLVGRPRNGKMPQIYTSKLRMPFECRNKVRSITLTYGQILTLIYIRQRSGSSIRKTSQYPN